MDINQKLEIFRKIYCLGEHDLKKIFGDADYEGYWKFKYEEARKTFGAYGNYHILFQLDEDNATRFLTYVGFNDPNAVKFIKNLL